MTGFGKYVDDLPPWAKGVITIGLLAAAGWGGYQLYKKSQDKKDRNHADDEKDASEKELKDLKAKGAKITFAESAYASAANEIQNKLDGCELLTSELEVIEQIVRVVKSPIDWLQLIKAFGTRKIDNCGMGTGDTFYALPALLKDQLDTGGLYAGVIIDKSGKPKAGVTARSLDLLLNYLTSIGVTI